jgi:phospholipase/carboxylesterase
MLTEHSIPPASGQKPARVVLFLHGVGDSGSGGLLSIGEIWQRAWPDCEFLCPDAPFPFEFGPPGFEGRQWFSLSSFGHEAMLEGAKLAAPYLNEYINHVLASRQLTADKLAIVGFSQGCIMALYALPRRADQVACILGYSGLIVGEAQLRAEKKSAPPVFLVHGRMDEIIPFASMDYAAHALKAAGIEATTLACPTTGHSIDENGIREGQRFIAAHWNS